MVVVDSYIRDLMLNCGRAYLSLPPVSALLWLDVQARCVHESSVLQY